MVGEARTSTSETGPLDGLTVIDASRVLVGPFCTMQLGDLGADVIKVERPGVGDQTRGWHPPRFGEGEEAVSAYYASVNRNKRSITLDLKRPEGRDLLRELVADADVFVENFRVGALEEWGLGYEDLRRVNPDLIYCSLSGYGEWGPYADRPAYDLILQAEAGLMGITGEAGGPPVRVGVAVADIGAGMYATQAILAALLERAEWSTTGEERSRDEDGTTGDDGASDGSGRGQKIDVSLFDGQVAWLSYVASYYFATGESPGRMGSAHPTIVPYRAFPTRDGHVVVAAPSEKLWERLCRALDRPDLLADERFETNADRVDHREELESILAGEFESYDTDEAVALLGNADVPARAVNDVAEVFDHPQTAARGMKTSVEHPRIGTVPMAASPMHFSRSSTVVDRHPPDLGEHTARVLAELGYDDAEIERLEDEGIV